MSPHRIIFATVFCLAAQAQAATPGDFDPAYGATAPGYTVTPLPDSAEAHDLVVLPDGSTITSATVTRGGTVLPVLTKYDPGGAIDPAFGVGGHAGPASTPTPVFEYTQLTRYRDRLYLLVVAGADLLVYNYSTAGVLNPAFGVGGVATLTTNAGNAVVDIAMQRSRIVVAGRMRNPATGEQDFLLAGLKLDGSLDAAFGVGGIALHSLHGGAASRESFTGLAIVPDGRIVAGGRTAKDVAATDPYDFVVARFRVDGSIDASFGATAPGFTTIDYGYNDFGRRVALYRNLQVVVAGSVCKTIDPATGDSYCMMGTARVLHDGTLDPGWNGSGTNLVDLGGDGLVVTDVVLDARERALVSHAWYRTIGADHLAGLTRYDFAGTLDPAFAVGGHAVHAFGAPLNAYHTVKLVDDKRVATCGLTGKEVAPGTLEYAMVVARHLNF